MYIAEMRVRILQEIFSCLYVAVDYYVRGLFRVWSRMGDLGIFV